MKRWSLIVPAALALFLMAAVPVSSQNKTISLEELARMAKAKKSQSSEQKTSQTPAKSSSTKEKKSTSTASKGLSSSLKNSGSDKKSGSAGKTLSLGKSSSGKFDYNDPLAEKNFKTAGTPWETAAAEPLELPAGVKAAVPKPLPDVNTISTMEYNTAVSYAFESMRIIYGQMSKKEAQAFTEAWAPLFNSPSQEIIDYLNKLNPLLTQFIVARDNYLQTLSQVEELMLDAAEAVDSDDREVFESTIFEANLLKNSMQQLNAAMTQIANQITALGNPPNPLEARAEARRRYNRVFPPAQKEVYIGEAWLGTRPANEYHVPGLDPLNEPLVRYMFKAKIREGGERLLVIQLKESGIPSNEERNSDAAILKYLRVEQVDYNNLNDERPPLTADGVFKSFLPSPPVLMITTMTMNLLRQFEMSYPTEEDKKTPYLYQDKEDYHNAAGKFGSRISEAGFFFKTAVDWAVSDKWNEYTYYANGIIPKECLRAFEEEVRQNMLEDIERRQKADKKSREEKAQAAKEKAEAEAYSPEAIRRKQIQDSLAFEEKSRQESIACREEICKSIQDQINREEEYRSRAQERLSRATTDYERQSARSEIEDINRRLMHYKSDLQDERDRIRGMQTGTFVHTRNAFDEYAFNKVIEDCKVEAARYNATKRATSIIDKQIQRLPEREREAARDRADKLFFENGALANGDYEKVRALGQAFNHTLEGYALKDAAEAKDAEAWADLKEAGANAVISACGTATVGIATSALTAAYGAEAAATIWGARVLGGVYGGVTGYIAGGPGKAASSAAGMFHPATATIASFVEGYTAESNEGMSVKEKIWEGVKQAGKDYLVGKLFEVGTGILTKTCTAISNKATMKFTKVNKKKLDMLRTQRQKLEAEDAVKAFNDLNNDYIHQLAQHQDPSRLIKQREQINQLAASLNADYHAKWYFKYKASPTLRAHFDQAVQANYRNMKPSMIASMDSKGYKMDGIDFKCIRNPSSAGSASMDLDYCPINKAGEQPKFFKKDGTEVPAADFMKDCQASMNEVYFKQHTISAKASEMNLTTSAHPEAFSNKELLNKNVDWAKIKPKDVADIGRVLEVKVTSIEGNVHMTKTTQMQAKCREANKEIGNMLLPKLKSDLSRCKPNSAEYKQIQGDIKYWERMNETLAKVGKGTNNPVELHKINIQVESYTGGKDLNQVVNDVIKAFGHPTSR